MTTNDERGQQLIGATGKLIKGLIMMVLVGAIAWACLTSHDSSTSTQSTPSTSAPTWASTGQGDAQYLQILKSHVFGITNADGDAGLIKGGHAICDGLQEGRRRESIFLQFVQGHGWSDSDASWTITASVVAYCPQFILPSDRW